MKMLRKLSLAVEQSPESVVITNLKTQIEYVNEAFILNTGYTVKRSSARIRACCTRAKRHRKPSTPSGML